MLPLIDVFNFYKKSFTAGKLWPSVKEGIPSVGVKGGIRSGRICADPPFDRVWFDNQLKLADCPEHHEQAGSRILLHRYSLTDVSPEVEGVKPLPLRWHIWFSFILLGEMERTLYTENGVETFALKVGDCHFLPQGDLQFLRPKTPQVLTLTIISPVLFWDPIEGESKLKLMDRQSIQKMLDSFEMLQ